MNDKRNKFSEFLFPQPAKNRDEAVKKIQTMEGINTILNAISIMSDDKDLEELLNTTKLWTTGQVLSADIDAAEFKIPNNVHLFDNPLDKVKENIVRHVFNATRSGVHNMGNAIKNVGDWGKQVKQNWPETQKIFLEKLDNDLNIPRKINEVFTPPKIEIEMGKPTKSIDSKGNVTLYGQIEKNENSEPKSRYKGYTNPLTNDNRIFSREDIGSFTTKEYSATEPEIMAQWRKIGIPTNGDLELDSRTTGGTVFVQAYTRSDGTKVKAHYRAA